MWISSVFVPTECTGVRMSSWGLISLSLLWSAALTWKQNSFVYRRSGTFLLITGSRSRRRVVSAKGTTTWLLSGNTTKTVLTEMLWNESSDCFVLDRSRERGVGFGPLSPISEPLNVLRLEAARGTKLYVFDSPIDASDQAGSGGALDLLVCAEPCLPIPILPRSDTLARLAELPRVGIVGSVGGRASTSHRQYSSRLKSDRGFSGSRAGKSLSGSPSPSCIRNS
mmetsp:Transcript_11562/g.25697  ORF Transcript_11562/g.25697 Transcript_11562/m.25697 type:complete len:225 (-) Transcript_11562:658-1332(-)